VQSAYEVLSDPQERAWYDSHRESILRADGGASEEEQFEHNVHLTSARDIVGLIGRFTTSVPFTDAPNGFYGILRGTFETLATEENLACDWQGIDPTQYPEFGGAEDDYEGVVKPFYRVWANFSTKKTFSWRDAYKSSDAPDRATRRLIEKENRRLREEGIREFNDAVRALVAFVRKRDPRYIPNAQSEADRQKILRDAAAAQAARSRAANQAKLNQHVVPDWAKTSEPETEDSFTESSESEVEHIECVVCGKTFKSEKQYETHEKSKKHIKAVQALQREMRQESRRLNLDGSSVNAPSTPTEALEGFNKLDLELTDAEGANEPTTKPTREKSAERKGGSLWEVKEPEDSKAKIDIPKQSPRKPMELQSDSSDVDDEYAPRADVENRLASSLSEAKIVEEGIDNPNPITVASPTPSDHNGTGKQKLGKAKAKRAKKAARQEMETAEINQGVSLNLTS
jgi:DnaJ family protein A protein 5